MPPVRQAHRLWPPRFPVPAPQSAGSAAPPGPLTAPPQFPRAYPVALPQPVPRSSRACGSGDAPAAPGRPGQEPEQTAVFVLWRKPGSIAVFRLRPERDEGQVLRVYVQHMIACIITQSEIGYKAGIFEGIQPKLDLSCTFPDSP